MDEGAGGPHGILKMAVVCRESEEAAVREMVVSEGGEVVASEPFDPDPDEVDFFADPQMDPFTVVAIVVSVSLCLRLVRQAARELRGDAGTVLMLDFSGKMPRQYRIPVKDARYILVKDESGVRQQFDPTDMTGVEEAVLGHLGRFRET